MNTLVNFELAKLLKEKGFNIPCREGWINYLVSFTGETSIPDDESNLVIDRLGNGHLIERPTIADVVMWLYEKHRIWISVSMVNNEEDNISFYYSITDNTSNETYFIITKSNFKYPIEAYEAAIEYTLKTLI